MIRRTGNKLIIATGLLLLFGSYLAAGPRQTFEQLSGEVLDGLQSFEPVRSTRLGIHSYDHRLADYSSGSVKNQVRKLKDFEQKLYKMRNSSFTPSQAVDFRLLKSNVDIALQDFDKIKIHQKMPQLYIDEAIDGIKYLMLFEHAPLSERLYPILARMQEVPRLFSQARSNIKTAPRVWIDHSSASLEAAIEFYRRVAAELMNKFPDRADDILKYSTEAREAMNDFLVHLSQIEVDETNNVAIGRANYDYKLSNGMFMTWNVDSLLAFGEEQLAHWRLQYVEYEEYVESQHQNGLDSVFVPASFNRQDLLDYFQWESNQVRFFLESEDIIALPDDLAEIQVVQTPDLFRPVVTGPTYAGYGKVNTGQAAYLFVRPVPPDLERVQLEARFRYVHRRGFRSTVVKEVYPGRHLLGQIAGGNQSAVRRWQDHPTMTEGWPLFAAELMYERGLYGEENPAEKLRFMGEMRLMAATLLVDVRLHSGLMSIEESVEWLADVLDAATEADMQRVRTLVNQCALNPTRAMSRLLGRNILDQLRDSAEMAEGPMFSESDFYERIMHEGTIPAALFWDIFRLDRLPQ